MVRIARKLVDKTVPGPSTRWGSFVPCDLSALISVHCTRTCDLSNDDPWLDVPRVVRCCIESASSPLVPSCLAQRSRSSVAVNHS